MTDENRPTVDPRDVEGVEHHDASPELIDTTPDDDELRSISQDPGFEASEDEEPDVTLADPAVQERGVLGGDA